MSQRITEKAKNRNSKFLEKKRGKREKMGKLKIGHIKITVIDIEWTWSKREKGIIELTMPKQR